MKIYIETKDSKLVDELLEKPSPPIGFTNSTSDNFHVTYVKKSNLRSEIGLFLLELSISFTVGVSSSVFATWLYNKIKDKQLSLRLNRRKTENDYKTIEEVLEEIFNEEDINIEHDSED